MLEELQEADVLWPDTAAADDRHHLELFITASMRRHDDKRASTGYNEDRRKGSSMPIAIPGMKTGGGRTDRREEEREVFEEAMVPPHILASRRNAGEVAFSLCGDGMRGRQLSYLRIAVLRMTGFLEN